jgi:hypothetical protein
MASTSNHYRAQVEGHTPVPVQIVILNDQDSVDGRYVSAPHFCFVHGSPEKSMALHHITEFSIVSGVSHSFLCAIED